MPPARAFASVVLLLSTLFLNGCYVLSRNVPSGTGPVNDQRLAGDWRGVDAETGREDDVYFHFQRPDEASPLRLVWVESNEYQVYEMRTMQVAGQAVFAARQVSNSKKEEIPPGWFIGYYEVSPTEARFWLLDSEKIGHLVEQGKLKGVKGKGRFDMTFLTGSPAELAAFLASPEARDARIEEPARLKRLPPAQDRD